MTCVTGCGNDFVNGFVEATHDRQHRCAEIRGEECVEFEFGCGSGSGVVGADDHHEFVFGLQRRETLDGAFDEFVLVTGFEIPSGFRVGHAVCVSRGLIDVVPGEQKIDHRIPTIDTFDDRTEQSDVRDIACKHVHQSECNRRLPGVCLG